jgi:hypothetical protein
MAGKTDFESSAAIAALGDTVGVTNIYEGATGRDAVTDRRLGSEERSTRLGTGIGTVALLATGSRFGRVGTSVGKSIGTIRTVPTTIVVRKTSPVDPIAPSVPKPDLVFIRQSHTVGKPGGKTYVTLAEDMEGVEGMESVYDKLTLDQAPGFTRSGTGIEFELRVPNKGFEIPKGTEFDPITGESLGFTKGGAMEFQIPSPSTSTITRFRFHSSGRTSPWIEGNPFE